MTSSDIKVSIIMVDGSFRERFHSIDYFGNQSLSPEEYELIWVEYYSQVNPELKEKIGRYPNFRIVTLGREGLYHSSYCFNEGIRQAKSELLIIPDADVVVESNFLETIWVEHQKNPQMIMYCFRYDEPADIHKSNWDLVHLRETCKLIGHSNFGACPSVRTRWLAEINGYEQHPIFASGFHANGRDVNIRLKNLGLCVRWHPNIRIYHPWHPSTLVGASAYDLQQLVIEHRASSLETRAFHGLDPALDSELPAALMNEIEMKTLWLRRKQGNILARLVYYVRALVHLQRKRAKRPALPESFLR